MDGTPLPRPDGKAPERPFEYHGFYRHGKRIVFAYRIGETEMLDSPWVEDGTFTRTVGPAEGHPLAASTRGGPSQWPQVLETRGKRGETRPYAVDTIEPPFRNPWNALMFFGDHDFFPDGTAMICTMQGDVWRVEGLDDDLTSVRWRRFASGLHQPLGLVIADGRVHVMGRDQLTRLHDLDGDGEADFYECVNNAYRDLAGGPRLRLRPATGRGREFLHRVRQPGAAQDRGRRPQGRGRSRRASATRPAWASRPRGSSPSLAPKGSGARRR